MYSPQKGHLKIISKFSNQISTNSKERTYRLGSFARSTRGPKNLRSVPFRTLGPLLDRPSLDPLTRDRLAPLAPNAPFTRTSRPVMRADRALRPIAPNGPKVLHKHLALESSRGPYALPTRDRHAPEPLRTYARPTSPPVMIERLDGPASRAAQP